MIKLDGNTYPVRDRLRALGCRWDAAAKAWMCPESRLEEANAVLYPVNGRPGGNQHRSATRQGGRAPRTCKVCGCKINYGVYCGKCEYA